MNNKKHTADNTIKVKKYTSPCGDMLIGAFDDRLCICDWMIEKHHATIRHRLEHALNAVMATGEAATTRQSIVPTRRVFCGQSDCL